MIKDTSQYSEGLAIYNHFYATDPHFVGTFLDIGAADGIINSNTRMLADAGWRGVLVEPAPQMFCQLMKNYRGYENVRLVNACVAAQTSPRIRPFQVNTGDDVTVDQISTLSKEHAAKWHGYPFREIYIPVITPLELIRNVCPDATIDFLNVDTEGTNVEVFRACMMFMKPRMVCVEADPPADVFELVSEHYANTATMGGNVLGWL